MEYANGHPSSADGVTVSSVVVPQNVTFLNNDEDLAALVNSNSNRPKVGTAEEEEDVAPRDSYSIAFCLMIVLGMSTTFGWNFFVTAADYFKYSFRNVNDPKETTPLQRVFENALALVAMSVGLVAIVVNTVMTRYISFKYRIFSGMIVIILVFVLTTVLAEVDTDSWQTGFFSVTMISVVFINFSSSLVAGGLFGIQGCLPTRFSTALMVGQTIAGILSALASTIAVVAGKDGGPNKNKDEAVGYFASATVFSVLAVGAFALFLWLPIVKFYLTTVVGITIVKTIEDTERVHSESVVLVKEPFSLTDIIKQTWTCCALLILNFFVTIAVYPAVASAVRSTHSSDGSLLTNDLFLPLACFLIANSGDMAGRLAHNFLRWPSPEQRFISLAIAVLRLAFIPLMMLCNAQPRSHLPVVFGDTAYVFLLASLFLTNGYLGNLGMMYGPKLVSAQFAETTGSIMGVCLSFGLFLGAASSFAWSALL